MKTPVYIPNFAGMEAMSSQVYDPVQDSPHTALRELQRAQYEDILLNTGYNFDRAEAAASLDHPDDWVENRLDRNRQVKWDDRRNDWEHAQQFGPSRVVVTRRAGDDRVVSGAIAAENVSAGIGRRLKLGEGMRGWSDQAEMRLKWAVPMLASRRYVHAEVIALPNALPALHLEEHEVAVSGLMLDSLYRVASLFKESQLLNIYLAPEDEDKADASTLALVSFLGMRRVREKLTHGTPGYPAGTVVATMQGNVGDILQRIDDIDGYPALRARMNSNHTGD